MRHIIQTQIPMDAAQIPNRAACSQNKLTSMGPPHREGDWLELKVDLDLELKLELELKVGLELELLCWPSSQVWQLITESRVQTVTKLTILWANYDDVADFTLHLPHDCRCLDVAANGERERETDVDVDVEVESGAANAS
ncbi:GH12471 [Drosophila grimshawi]|uniref:GH12471 n=1 Tax=Drosophila grimshawi TaxID=7222 RepID=B4JJE1_DROGR|nr:GH12471 [Drosophila grimshawi]